MTTQKMCWGRIDWLHTPDEVGPGQSMSMNVGICTILPQQRQYEHVHYGVEQFIFILKGASTHIVNGVKSHLTEGQYIHLRAWVTHDTINDGDEPAVEMLISIPVSYSPHIALQRGADDEPDSGNYRGNLYAAVEAVDARMMESFRAPFTIFDDQWAIIWQNTFFSKFCNDHCRPSVDPGQCECLRPERAHMRAEKDHNWFVCSHGHVVYDLPIIYRGHTLGSMRGGHIVVSDLGASGDFDYEGVYDTPLSTANGIQRLLHQVIKSIVAYCEFDMNRMELRDKNRALWETEHHRLALERTLRLTEDRVTNLRINRHFLFNTLNCMADMALRKKGQSLYSAIIQLARLFRYVMPADQTSVTLHDELEYVDNYLSLQKLRYGNNLLVAKSVDAQLMTVPVPMNFLQPIVENAFTHGFRDSVGLMRIALEATLVNDRVRLCIRNNGKRLDETTLLRVRNGLSSPSGHGLSLIYTKLASAYGENFEMSIDSELSGHDETMTVVSLSFPTSFRGRYHD